MEDVEVQKGDEVVLVVSKGPETPQVTVPSFINSDISDIERKLDSLGLKLGKVDRYNNDEYAEGKIYWQSIPVDKEVDKGTTIDFWVSLGPKETAPPETEPPTVPPTDPPAPPTQEPPVPTQDVTIPTSTQFIPVDLNAYTGTVEVRIVVGDQIIFDGAVDVASTDTGILRKPATASGVQLVSIYINGTLDRSYSLDFTP